MHNQPKFCELIFQAVNVVASAKTYADEIRLPVFGNSKV